MRTRWCSARSTSFFAALVLLALSQLKAGREGLAGLLLGGSILIKPYGIVFLPYLIARLRRAALVGLGSCLAAGLFLPVISYGLLGTRAELTGWIRTLRETTVPTLTNTGNISVFSLYAKWPVADAAAMILLVITVVGLMVVCLVIFARRRQVAFPEYLEVSLLLTLIPLLSPQGWDYVLLVSTPAVMCLVNYFGDLPRRLRVVVGVSLATVGFSLFDLMGRTAYYAFMSLSVITLCYFVLVAALYHLRAQSLA